MDKDWTKIMRDLGVLRCCGAFTSVDARRLNDVGGGFFFEFSSSGSRCSVDVRHESAFDAVGVIAKQLPMEDAIERDATRTETKIIRAGQPVHLLGGPLLPERDVEGEAARDVRGIGEVQQGPRRVSGAKTKQVPALLLLLQQQVVTNIVARVGPDHHERAL